MPSSENLTRINKKLSPIKKPAPVEYESDIDPDDLLPVYLESKSKLFRLQSSSSEVHSKRRNFKSNDPTLYNKQRNDSPELSKLLRKIKKIEDDVLFDKFLADKQWDVLRIQLEKEAAAERHASDLSNSFPVSESPISSDDEISREAAKMGQDLLDNAESDDDEALADLFASLPVSEVDPLTGKTNTVVNGANGVKVVIRDFGKWSGVNPTRILEEACRARQAFATTTSTNIIH